MRSFSDVFGCFGVFFFFSYFFASFFMKPFSFFTQALARIFAFFLSPETDL